MTPPKGACGLLVAVLAVNAYGVDAPVDADDAQLSAELERADDVPKGIDPQGYSLERLFPVDEPARPFSFGGDFAGRSNLVQRGRLIVSGEARLRWYEWLESIFGVTLGFAGGDGVRFGVRLPQRLYFNLPWVQPYVQGGFRADDLTRYESLALEVGTGVQVTLFESVYFEAGLSYVISRFFHDNVENYVLFNGGSGLRF